jgi:hypothetical protein
MGSLAPSKNECNSWKQGLYLLVFQTGKKRLGVSSTKVFLFVEDSQTKVGRAFWVVSFSGINKIY